MAYRDSVPHGNAGSKRNGGRTSWQSNGHNGRNGWQASRGRTRSYDPSRDSDTDKEAGDDGTFLRVNREAEDALIGALQYDAEYTLSECAEVQASDFYQHNPREIWTAAQAMRERGESINLITLGDWLDRQEQHEAASAWRSGSYQNRIESPSGLLDLDKVGEYAKIVRLDALSRQGFRAVSDLAALFHAGLGDAGMEALQEVAQWVAEKRAEIVTDADDGFMSVTEAKQMKPARGIIGDVLYEDSIAMLYGPSGTWKSFVALSMGLSLATDENWLGRTTLRGGHVIYAASEGRHGMGARIQAWQLAHGIEGDPTRFHLSSTVNLLDTAEVRRFIARIRRRIQQAEPDNPEPFVSAIVIDTLARSMPGGDENATQDSGTVIDNLAQLRDAFGCCVLAVHHTGKDTGRGLRGNSRFYNDVDTVIRIRSPRDESLSERITPGEPINLVSEKPKDTEHFRTLVLTTQREEWADEETGEPHSSLVIVSHQNDGMEPGPLKPKVGRSEVAMMDAMRSSLNERGMTTGEIANASSVSRATVNRLIGTLVSHGLVRQLGEKGDLHYQLTENGVNRDYKQVGA